MFHDSNTVLAFSSISPFLSHSLTHCRVEAGRPAQCCCCVSLMVLTQDCTAILVSSYTACLHLSCGCYCKRWRDLLIPPSSSPPGLHHLAEVLFCIGQKSSKSKGDLSSLIDFGEGLVMEMGMVREVCKPFCSNVSSCLLLTKVLLSFCDLTSKRSMSSASRSVFSTVLISFASSLIFSALLQDALGSQGYSSVQSYFIHVFLFHYCF